MENGFIISPILGKWNMDPKKIIIMARAPPTRENNGIEMENGSITFCYRNPYTEEMERGPKENNNGAPHPPLPTHPKKKWTRNGIWIYIIFYSRNPNIGEIEHGPKENINNGVPPLRKRMKWIWKMDPLFILHLNSKENAPPFPLVPIIEKIMDSKWIMDPLFSALEWNRDGKWIHYFLLEKSNTGEMEHGPKENIHGARPPPPTRENNGIEMENGSSIFCHRNPSTEEMERGPKKIINNTLFCGK